MINPILQVHNCAGKYYFDADAASRAVNFFPTFLSHAKGLKPGAKFELLEYQKEIVSALFGWKTTRTRKRRFRHALIAIPRKNGKTTLAAGLALYLTGYCGEEQAEVIGAAYTRDQASLVFEHAEHFVSVDKDLRNEFDVLTSRKRMVHRRTKSKYRAIASEAASIHGESPSGIIFDEVHTQKTRELWDVLDTGTGARSEPLTIAITTAGHDRSSICWELWNRGLELLEGNVQQEEDPTFFAAIFSAQPEEDWTDPDVWARCNPSLGEALSIEHLAEQCAVAQKNPEFENTFRNLHLNQWTEQAIRWISMRDWDECESEPYDLTEADFLGAGLDLANTRDVNALVIVARFDREEGAEYFMQPYFWIPEESKDTRAAQDRRQIVNWANKGYVAETEGKTTFYPRIRSDLWDLLGMYPNMRLAFDPWGSAHNIIQDLELGAIEGDNVVEFRQTIGSFARPCKRFEELICSHQIHHDGNPVLRWMAGNAVKKEDPSGNIRPDKSKSGDKIDGIVAAIMGLALCLEDEDGSATAYDTEAAAVFF